MEVFVMGAATVVILLLFLAVVVGIGLWDVHHGVTSNKETDEKSNKETNDES
jgi:Na+-transporting methylmalonyl-CoA/oxaloacetate decarboxylase gamma subunit